MSINKDRIIDTLFVSDLDGTLLDRNALFPNGVKEHINQLVDIGCDITYATARTIRSADKILSGINMTSPVALMNGVLVRDMNEKRYILTNRLSEGQKILDILLENDIKPFVYSVDTDDELAVAYEELYNDFMVSFVNERKTKYSKPFTKIDNIGSALNNPSWVPVYIVAIDYYDRLKECAEKINQLCSSHCSFYKDAYVEGLWYLEASDVGASKGNAIEFLRKHTMKKNIVVFGDNRNDIPMFEHADISVCVENASEEVKAKANFICRKAEDDGVAKFIEDYINNRI